MSSEAIETYWDTVDAVIENYCVPNMSGKEKINKFENEEEAVTALYSELFDSQCKLDRKLIYDALCYLTWKKDINHVYDEIVELNEDMIRVEHVCEKEK